MKMKLNRITTSLAGALFVFALVSCAFEMPESVRIKSNPGLYVFLGSPFAGGPDSDMSFSEYLSEDGLKKQLGGENGDIDILDWDGEKPTQAYRIRYPVANINMNLTEYVQEMDVASNAGGNNGWIPGTGSEIVIPLPLDSMSFAKEVTGATISVTLKFYAPPANSKAVPTADTQGSADVPEGTEVRFPDVELDKDKTLGNRWTSKTISTFKPATDKISIGVTVPTGTWFSPELDFDWKTAVISIGETGKQEGQYKLDFSGFSSFLGKGVSLKRIEGYMYQDGNLGATANFTLEWKSGKKERINSVSEKLVWKAGSFNLPPSSHAIDLKNLFNEALTLDYDLTLPDVSINKTDNNDRYISINMVILLPLELAFDPAVLASKTFPEFNKLDLEMLRSLGNGSGGDLFGRDSNDEEMMFKEVKDVTIILGFTGDLRVENLHLGIAGLADFPDPFLINSETLAPIPIGEIPNPFNPKFELLVPTGKTLKILRGADDTGGRDNSIDLTIAVEATTELDYQVTF